jgi:hypothetical protein
MSSERFFDMLVLSNDAVGTSDAALLCKMNQRQCVNDLGGLESRAAEMSGSLVSDTSTVEAILWYFIAAFVLLFAFVAVCALRRLCFCLQFAVAMLNSARSRCSEDVMVVNGLFHRQVS